MLKLTHRRITLAVFVALTVAVGVACSSGSSDSKPGSNQAGSSEARITAKSGGELRSQDGSFLLTVPPGAVSKDVTISFSQLSAGKTPGELPGAEGASFDLQPDGLQFAKPALVTLTLPIESEGTDDESRLSTFDLFSISSDGEVTGLENISNDFDTENGEVKVTGELAHFSTLFRRKKNITVSLQQVEPKERAVGTTWFVTGEVVNTSTGAAFEVDWELQAEQAISLAHFSATRLQYEFGDDPSPLPATFTPAKASSTGAPLRDAELFTFTPHLRCDSPGRGVYTLKVATKTVLTEFVDDKPRNHRFSLAGVVNCVSAAEATAATGDSGAATAVSGILEPTQTPTAVPTPTSVPAVGKSDEKLRLVIVATSGSHAPGTSDRFNAFDAPTTGGGNVFFHGFTDGGTSGIWRYEEDDLVGGTLSNYIATVNSPLPGSIVWIESVPVPATESGLSATIARIKSTSEFTDGIFAFTASGFPVTPVSEGDPAPGVGENAKFTLFRNVQLTDQADVVFAANAGKEGIWMWRDGQTSLLAFEGQALPGLPAGWKSKSVRSVGVTDDGTVLLFLDNYRNASPRGDEEQGDGLWRVGVGNPLKVVQTGDTGPDGQAFTQISDASMNSIAQVAFLGRTQKPGGAIDIGVWKTTPRQQLARVAGTGDAIAALGIVVAEVSSPLMLDDGRVMFVASAFSETGTLVEYVLVESGNGFEVVAFSETLPGADGAPIDTSSYRPGIAKLSANAQNHVAFELGLAFGIWMQSPSGSLHRVVGIGDKLQVPAAAGGKVEKSVAFAEFVGDVATRTGQPTAYSDLHDLVLRVQFNDGTEAIILATFSEAPIVP